MLDRARWLRLRWYLAAIMLYICSALVPFPFNAVPVLASAVFGSFLVTVYFKGY